MAKGGKIYVEKWNEREDGIGERRRKGCRMCGREEETWKHVWERCLNWVRIAEDARESFGERRRKEEVIERFRKNKRQRKRECLKVEGNERENGDREGEGERMRERQGERKEEVMVEGYDTRGGEIEGQRRAGRWEGRERVKRKE